MGALVAIGSVLPDASFYLKYNSVNDFSIFFWDDSEGLTASDLTGAVATIEVDSPTIGTLFATGSRVGSTNEMKFIITATGSTAVPDGTTFRVVLTKNTTDRYIIASGKVRVQR